MLTVFVHAPLEIRINHVMDRDGLDSKEAEERIKTIDRERAEHSLSFANATWGAAETHHLVLDSSIQSPRDAAKLIANLAKKAFSEAPLSPCPEKPERKS